MYKKIIEKSKEFGLSYDYTVPATPAPVQPTQPAQPELHEQNEVDDLPF